MSPADSASRAGATPEASGDCSSGTLGKQMILFKYTPTFRDYLLLNLYGSLKVLGLRRIAITWILATILLVFLKSGGTTSPIIYPLYFLSLIPLLVILVGALAYFGARKRWNASEELRGVRDYKIDENGVSVNGPSFNGFLEWKNLAEADKGYGLYFLKTAQSAYYYFPVDSIADQPQFIQLVSDHVSTTRSFRK